MTKWRGQTGAMLDPSLTKVLFRRVVAALIDFATVGLLAFYFASTQSEKFLITERDQRNNEPIWSEFDFERIQSYADGFNRAEEFGDTLHVFDLVDVILITVVTTLLFLLSKVLIPANTGWSLGQGILGLRVTDENGEPPSLVRHLTRMVPALIDVLPVILPGLAGWLLARRSVQTQRLGDRIAKTFVISRNSELRFVDEDAWAREQERARQVEEAEPEPVDESMVDLSSRLSSPEGTRPPPAGAVLNMPAAAPVLPPQPEVEVPSFDTPSFDTPSFDTPSFDTNPLPPVPVDAPITELDDPVVAAQQFNTDPPPPVPVDAPTFDVEQFDAPVFEQSPADEILSEPAIAPPVQESGAKKPPPPAHRSAAERQAVQQATVSPERVAAAATPQPVRTEGEGNKAVPPPRHRVERTNWDHPVAEHAPVWTPPAQGGTPEITTTAPAVTQAATQQAADQATAAPVPIAEPTPASNNEPSPVAESSTEPQWNEEWSAWMFWDAGQNTWLRHDPETDTWHAVKNS